MEIVPTYKSMRDENDIKIPDRKMFGIYLNHLNKDGSYSKACYSEFLLHDDPMISFVIDDNIFSQIDNILCLLIDGKYRLVMKEGYKFITLEEQETPEQAKIRELKEQLAMLEATQKQGE